MKQKISMIDKHNIFRVDSEILKANETQINNISFFIGLLENGQL